MFVYLTIYDLIQYTIQKKKKKIDLQYDSRLDNYAHTQRKWAKGANKGF